MLYFSFYELSLACISFIFLGLIFGTVYPCAFTLASGVGRLTRLPSEVVALIKKPSRERISEISIREVHVNSFLKNLIDFIILSIFGISQILLSYVFLDGTVRILPPLLSTVCFYLGARLVRRYLIRYFLCAFTFLYRIIVITLALIVKSLTVILWLLFFPVIKIQGAFIGLFKKIKRLIGGFIKKKMKQKLYKS